MKHSTFKILLTFMLPIFLATSSEARVSVSQISMGTYNTCVLDQDQVKCWGNNRGGQNHVPPLLHPTQVSVGTAHICAIDQEGIKCWGQTNGSGKELNNVNFSNLSHPKQISVGDHEICAIDAVEGVSCYGLQSQGIFPKPEMLRNPTQISSGRAHSCAIVEKGLICWGDNEYGQIDVPPLLHPTQVSAGTYNTCAIDQNGIKCWGFMSKDIPQPHLNHPTQISTGTSRTCAIDQDGATCWGLDMSYDTKMPSLNHPTQIAVRGDRACALDLDGVKCWGRKVKNEEPIPAQFVGPRWGGFHDNSYYLKELSNHVYSFDRDNFTQLSALGDTLDGNQSSSAFFLLALFPHLQQLGYPEVEKRYVISNLERTRHILQSSGYTSMSSLKDDLSARRLALQMLAISLKTATPVISSQQRAQIEGYLALFAKALPTDLDDRDMKQIVDALPEMEKLLTEMSRNPYLTGRTASALALTRYLAGL